jgi:hypothetical protein
VAPKWWNEWGELRANVPLLPGPLGLQDARDNYQDNTRSLSTVARQLAYAGIALVWIFKSASGGHPAVAGNLRIPTLLLIGALGADLLQYISSASSWGFFELRMEKKFQRENLDEDLDTFGAPNSINWPGNTFLVVKVGLLVVAYVWMFTALYHRLFF